MSTPNMARHDICWHSKQMTDWLTASVVNHTTVTEYYLAARLQRFSSYVVSAQMHLYRSRPTPCKPM